MTQQQQQQPRQLFPKQDGGVLVTNEETDNVVNKIGNNGLSAIAANITTIERKNSQRLVDSSTEDGPSSANALSEKLSQLSLEERTHGIYELHGVADIEEESPTMLRNKLHEISVIANGYNEDERTLAYKMATTSGDRQYAEKIKLLCLRADYYDCSKAAARLVSFLSFKRRLFGDDKLTRDVVFDDFQGEDRHALEAGILQLLQQRDRAGRAVLYGSGSLKRTANNDNEPGDFPMESLCRCVYYCIMEALRDEEIQKRGIVFVYYMLGQTKFYTDRPAKVANLFWLLPVRLAAMHTCCNSPLQNEIAQMIAKHMEAHYLCRFRTHNGSHTECLYEMMTFGIPKDVWPVGDDGELNLEFHHQWLNIMRNRERAAAFSIRNQQQNTTTTAAAATPPTTTTSSQNRLTSSCSSTCTTPDISEEERNYPLEINNDNSQKEVSVPGPLDILLGRGKSSKSSAGYLRLRNLIEQYSDEYDNAERYEKTVIVDYIVTALQQGGCRFVRMHPDIGLVQEPVTVAREKRSHAFRDARRTKKLRNDNGNNKNGTKRERGVPEI